MAYRMATVFGAAKVENVLSEMEKEQKMASFA